MPTDSYDETIDKIALDFGIPENNHVFSHILTGINDILPRVTDGVFQHLCQTGKLNYQPHNTNDEEMYREIFTQIQQILANNLRIAPSVITPDTSFKKIIPFRKRAAVIHRLAIEFRRFPIFWETSRFGFSLMVCSFLVIPSATMLVLGFMMVPDFVMFGCTILMFFLVPFLTYWQLAKNFCDFPYKTVHDLVQKTLEYRFMTYQYIKIGAKITRIIAENFDPQHIDICTAQVVFGKTGKMACFEGLGGLLSRK